MILDQPATWPSSLIDFLDQKYQVLIGFQRHERETLRLYLEQKDKSIAMAMMPGNPYFQQQEEICLGVRDLIRGVSILGWHCTRLIDQEIVEIRDSGLSLPNEEFLHSRITRLKNLGLISTETSNRLVDENQASEVGRRERIWFCLYHPFEAGKDGIERFFRHWGGEALYNCHEDDFEISQILAAIGTPCLVEVNVPAGQLNPLSYLGTRILEHYLHHREGHADERVYRHDDYSVSAVPPQQVARIIRHGEVRFEELTHCDKWIPQL